MLCTFIKKHIDLGILSTFINSYSDLLECISKWYYSNSVISCSFVYWNTWHRETSPEQLFDYPEVELVF